MRPGRVTTVRINPQDCLSIVDIVDALKIPRLGMSFAQATKIALASMLESMRQNNIIPTRDGFEYSEMMRDFPDGNDYSQRGRQLKVAQLATHPSFAPPPIVRPPPAPVMKEPDTPEKKRKRIRYQELMFKFQNAQESFDDDDMKEYMTLMDEFQLEGVK